MIDEPDADWLKNDRDYWMRRAKTAEGERDAWDENHQILSEHYERMTHERDAWQERARVANEDAATAEAQREDEHRRALSAEQTADWFKNDRDHWMDCAHGRGSRIERADEEINRLKAQAREWKAEAEKAEALADKHSGEIDRLANALEAKDQRIADVEHVAEELDADLAAMGEKFERARAEVVRVDSDLEWFKNDRDYWKNDRDHWMDRAEKAEADKPHAQADNR